MKYLVLIDKFIIHQVEYQCNLFFFFLKKISIPNKTIQQESIYHKWKKLKDRQLSFSREVQTIHEGWCINIITPFLFMHLVFSSALIAAFSVHGHPVMSQPPLHCPINITSFSIPSIYACTLICQNLMSQMW